MKRFNNIILACLLLTIVGILGRCTKSNAWQPSVSFSFTSAGDKFITTDVTLNPKDSVNFQYTATASSGITKIIIKKGLTVTDTIFVPAASATSYTGTKKAVMDSVPGVYAWTFSAYDAGGVIMGSKSLVVTITADYIYYTNKVLYVPDTTAKTNKTYFASATGNTYSYSGIGSDAGAVDFGFFYDTTTANKHTIYALSANPISFYDLSSWTKNATIFKKVTTVSMASLSSTGALKTAGLANLGSGTASKITALAQGNVILFKTAAGKYGAISISYINAPSPAATTFMAFDVKIQK